MIEITIDYNNDEIVIDNGSDSEIKMKLKHPEETQKVIYEIINMIFYRGESVCLTRIDEDTKTRIEEW